MKFFTHQGDVPIYKVNLKETKHLSFKEVKELVVAEGETTGHQHKVLPKEGSKLKIAFDGFGYYLKVSDNAELTHQEHKTKVLPALPNEVYYFGQQQEYDPVEYRKRVLD